MNRVITVSLAALLLIPATLFGQTFEDLDADVISAEARPAREGQSPDLQQAVQRIIDSTNQFRQDEGLESVEVNRQLTETAQYFADYMARTNRYGHTADGQRPSQRASEHGYEYCMVSENIAYQFSTRAMTTDELSTRFVQGWKDSPEHRENMLDTAATETGVAITQSDESGYYYAVQMFGRPRSEQIEFQIANRSGAEVQYQIGDRTYPLPPRFSRTHQRCRLAEVTFQWPEEGQKSQTIQPASGDRFTIVREAGEFRLQRQ